MRISLKEVGFAAFFLMVIALVAVQAADDHGITGGENRTAIEDRRGE